MELGIGSGRCKRCSIKINNYNIRFMVPSWHNPNYEVCESCWDEWNDNDYHSIWDTLYNTCSYELANKFVLDFLGKLD